MSEELERKRQEKIANFKLNISDPEELPAGLNSDISSAGENPEMLPSGELPDPAQEPVEEVISSSEEINSFSSPTEKAVNSVDKRSLRKAKRIDRKRRRKKAKKNRIVFRLVWISMLLFLSVMIGEFVMVGVNDLLGVGRENRGAVTITIPKDADIDTITDILYENHVINNKWSFKLYAKLTKATGGFTQGTFEIATNKDYQALINYMQSDMNRTDVVRLQFTEGMTLRQYAKLLDKNKVCDEEEFLEACNSSHFDEYDFIGSIKNTGKRCYKLEGYLFPDTYDFYVGEKVDNVIEKFLANYRRKVYGTKRRFNGFENKTTIAKQAEEIGMPVEDVLTLASLIQAEAADKEDMYMISAILHNRLATQKTGGINSNGEGGFLKLQLDSTVLYLEEMSKEKKSAYSKYYNTYNIENLPAGPICNPGEEAIKAALTVEPTEYYYFCHKSATEDSPAVAYYAKTNEEHLENLREAGLLN